MNRHPLVRGFTNLGLLSLGTLLLSPAAVADQSCKAPELRRELMPHFAQCPNNTMSFVIGYNPGGNTDTVGRFFQSYLETIATDSGATAPAFNTVIESKPGASGEIGSRYVVDAEGKAVACRLLVAQSNQLTTNKFGVPNAINPQTDLKVIAQLGEAPLVLAVNARTSPHKAFADFEKYVRSGGDRVFYGSNGNYATDHLAMEILLHNMGTKAIHVPFTGSGPMIQSLLSGSDKGIDFALVSVGLIRAYLLDGRLRAIGVARPEEIRLARGDGQPPLVIEPISRFVPEFQYASMWVALAGNRKMPDAVGSAMGRAVQCFAENPKVRQTLTGEMMFELGGSRELLLRRMQNESVAAMGRFGG